MRFLFFAVLLLPSLTCAETYICSFPGYISGEPVILKLEIDGGMATDTNAKDTTQYKVLENNKYGVVLVRSFSEEGFYSPKENEVGLFGVVIDKVKMKMLRGNIIYGDMANSLKTGTCAK